MADNEAGVGKVGAPTPPAMRPRAKPHNPCGLFRKLVGASENGISKADQAAGAPARGRKAGGCTTHKASAL
eukprot:4371853-Prymnesium_polylepis.1